MPPAIVSASTPATMPVERKAMARRSRCKRRAVGRAPEGEEVSRRPGRGRSGVAIVAPQIAEAEDGPLGRVELDQKKRGEESAQARPAGCRWRALPLRRDGSASSRRGLC